MAHADNNSSCCLFIDTNLDTHFATIVFHSDTVSDLKRKILLEHHQCFPAIGDIKIDALKVKLRQHFYHLPDSMLVSSAFANVKDNWFLSVDASRLAQGVGIQQVDSYKVGDQLALTYATDNRSADQRSPSTHLTIVPIVNHVVSTTGNSDKDYLKHTEEDRPFDNEINSKKRTLVQATETLAENASGSGPSVEKKRKTEEKEASVKASEDLGGENIRTNNANSMENNIQDLNDESTRLSKGGKCSGLDQEATVVSSSIENVVAEILSEISRKEKDESLFVQNNSEALVVEISKPTEVVEETLKEMKDAAGRRKKKKDVGRSATRNDAASVTNEKTVLPHSGIEESQVITLTEKNVSQGNDEGIDRELENQNESMDGEKKNKRKKKTKKSAKNGEGGMSTEVSDPHLNETTLLDAARKDGDEVKGRDAQVSDVGLVTKPKKNKKSSVTGPEYPTNVVNDPNIPNTDQFETPKKKSKIDAPRISKSAHANKAHGEPSAENQKSSKPRVVLGLVCVRAMQKSRAPEINKSQHAKSLLSGSGTRSGGDIDESSADDDALSGKSSSLGDSASSTDSRRNGSRAVKRKGAGGNSQSKSKNISMTDRPRSSPRFKRAKVTASQQLGDTESEPVDFVPESPPIAK